MPGHVADDLAAGQGMADQRHVVQIERFDHRRQIVGQRVEIIASPRIARPAMAATVISDAAQPLLAERLPLIVPEI